MADRKYKITFELSDGSEKSVEFTAPQGENGKSAYEYARGAGYPGTEEEFSQKLANENSDDIAAVASSSDIVSTVSGEVVTVSDSSDRELRGLKVFGKTEQNGIPTPEAPVPLESVGDVTVTVAGKNMFPKAPAGELSKNGITFTSDGNGSYSVRGTATGYADLTFDLEECVVLKEGMYIHFMNNVSSDISFVYWYSDNTYSFWAFSPVNRISAPTKNFGKEIVRIGVNVQSGTSIDLTFSPMFVFSKTPMDFVPYQSIQIIPISTDYGLTGIPVTSGGNHTDASGQQWICDEVDFEKGQYVQNIIRCNNWRLANSNTNIKTYAHNTGAECISGSNGVALCNVTNEYSYSQSDSVHIYVSTSTTNAEVVVYVPAGYDIAANPIEALAALAVPRYHTLTAEQLAAFAQLHSNYPSTTVFNDKNAGMEVKYVADTKLYIDKKFTELAAAIVNN